MKETKEVTKLEKMWIDNSIEKLQDVSISLNNMEYKIKIDVQCTMFDGKVINALTDSPSTQSCNVCGAKPTEMNNLELVRSKKVSEGALKLGVSSLHSWIRTFEYLLHVGYRKKIQKYQVRGEEDKKVVAQTKI